MTPFARAFIGSVLCATSALGQGCTTRHRPVHAATARRTVAKPPATVSDAVVAPPGGPSCVSVGPLRCNAAPALGTGEALCAQLRACELGSDPGSRGEPVEKVTRCTEPIQLTKLLGASGFGAVAVVRLEGETAIDDEGESGDPAESAYLVAERAGLWCAVSRLLPFDSHPSGRLEDAFRLTPLPGQARLYVSAHRVEHGSLDADEFAAGVSDVEYEGCDQYLYSLDSSGFREVRHKWTTPSSCAPGAFGKATTAREGHGVTTQDAGDGALRCAGVGPLACDLGEGGEASQLCARLTQCAKRWNEPWLLRDIESCVESGQRLSLPPGTGTRRASVLHTMGMHDAVAAESAYLVVERSHGFCLVDQLFDPTEGYRKKPAPSFELIWNEDKQRLDVVCEHASRSPFSGARQRAPVIEYDMLTYTVRDGAFTRVEQQTRRELP